MCGVCPHPGPTPQHTGHENHAHGMMDCSFFCNDGPDSVIKQPSDVSEMELLHIHSLNITSAFTHQEFLLSPHAHIKFVQEASMNATQSELLRGTLAEHQYRYHFTCTDPEYVRPVGGVGAVVSRQFRVHTLKPITPEYAKIANNGRTQLVAIGLPNGVVLTVGNIYGWTGGAPR